jgi:hypothetical protein
MPSFDVSNLSAFGTLETAELQYILQGDFVYGLNTQLWATAVTSGTGATVDTNSSRLRIQCGTAVAGYAYITSKKTIRYRAGQGTNVRFTPLFSTGVVNNIQLWGVGTIASNAPSDGYFVGYNGTTLSIAHYIAGTPTWIPQSSWNGNPMNGTVGGLTWNPTLGSPVMIKYPYLGFGDIFFYVQNPNTGGWVLVHTIRYANTAITTQLSNPTLQFLGYTQNSGNTTNMTMYCGSVGIAVSGVRSFLSSPRWSTDVTKSGVTTESLLLSIQNCTSFNSVTNRGMLRMTSFSCSSSANNVIGTFRFKVNATIGGSPSYTPVNGSGGGATITAGNSITSVDTAGSYTSGGIPIFSALCGVQAGYVIDVTPYELIIAPGEILTITGAATGASTLGVTLSWHEDI